jgi:hypothetical protein
MVIQVVTSQLLYLLMAIRVAVADILLQIIAIGQVAKDLIQETQ